MARPLETPARWERIARAAVLISVLLAVATQHALWLDRATLPFWLLLDAVVVGVGILARFRPSVALGLVLLGSFLLHGRMLAYLGLHSMAQLQPGMMGLLSVALARGPRLSWSLPVRWRAPLIYWALAVGLSWPVVFLRELDFAPLLTLAGSAATVNNGFGVRAVDAAGWVAQTAVVQLGGLIWVDNLFRRADSGAPVVGQVLPPLAAGLAVAFPVTCWQAYVDVGFLNFEHWSSAGRATGTLLDGNALGITAALLGPAVLARARARAAPGSLPARAALPLAAAVLIVLLSGSTSGLLILAAGITAAGWALVQERRRAGRALPWSGLAGLAAVVAVALVVSLPARDSSLERLARFVPESDQISAGTLVSAQLRDRPFFAQLGLTMVAEWPVAGVGIGSFHTLANDVAVAHEMTGWVEFENALNWYVHQIAELGVVGSLGWLLWIAVLLPLLLGGLRQPPSAVLAATLLGFGVASLFGVHAQNPEVLVSFWFLVFWLAQVQGLRPGVARRPGSTARRRAGVSILCLAVIYGALQAAASLTSLRVESRAAMAGWSYETGFHGWEVSERLGDFRWTHRRARVVLEVRDRWLEVSLAAFRPDLRRHPLHVDILLDDQVVRTLSLTSQEPVTLRLPMPAAQCVRLEIRPASLWLPAEDGLPDHRALGVAVGRCRFVAGPGPLRSSPDR